MNENYQKALIYCRVSDTKQKTQGNGLQSQEHRGRQFAAQNNLEVVEVYHDDVSGGGDFTKRPEMRRLLTRLKKDKHINYVVIFDDIKRASRDTYFYWGLINKLQAFNAQPMSPNGNFEQTPEGRFSQNINVSAAQYERETIARQNIEKKTARLEAGYYPFACPVGYYNVHHRSGGNLLTADPKIAPVIKTIFEGLASGRFQTAAEVKLFLEQDPNFPKQATGKIGRSRVKNIITNPLYAGFVEYLPYGVSRRMGNHKAMVSFETFQKANERLSGRAVAPARPDLDTVFPLRGSVICTCGNYITGYHAKSCTGRRYAYYHCQNKACEHGKKSIPKKVIEDEFEALLAQLSPSDKGTKVMDKMFKQLWNHREKSEKQRFKLIQQQSTALNKDIDRLVDKLVETSSERASQAIERKLEKLEDKKRLLDEKMAQNTPKKGSEMKNYRTALAFIYNPLILWQKGNLEIRNTMLKLLFTEPITYERNIGYRTTNLSLPFKHLRHLKMEKRTMVPTARLELARLSSLPPQDSVSTSSTTSAI